MEANRKRADTAPAGAWISLAAGVLMVVSAFLPWVTASGGFINISRNAMQLGDQQGFSVDGVVLIVLGLVTALIGVTRLTQAAVPSFIQRSPIITGAAAGFVALDRLPAINDLVQRVHSASALISASVGFGLWVAVVAGALAIIGGLVLRTSTGPSRSAQPATPTSASDSASARPANPSAMVSPRPDYGAPPPGPGVVRECPPL
jgi:hypothetical protein